MMCGCKLGKEAEHALLTCRTVKCNRRPGRCWIHGILHLFADPVCAAGGVSTKIQGFVISISQASLFFLPISVVQYVPNFYFGALLMVFGIEILFDWLVAPFGRVSRAEYLLLWGTFLAIVNSESSLQPFL